MAAVYPDSTHHKVNDFTAFTTLRILLRIRIATIPGSQDLGHTEICSTAPEHNKYNGITPTIIPASMRQWKMGMQG